MERAVKRAMAHDASAEKKRAKKAALGLASTAATPATTTPGTPVRRDSVGAEQAAVNVGHVATGGTGASPEVMLDLEKKEVVVKRSWWRRGQRRNTRRFGLVSGTSIPCRLWRVSSSVLPTLSSYFPPVSRLCAVSPSLILHERFADIHINVA
jgi:Ni/Co efflux regulator RcnB